MTYIEIHVTHIKASDIKQPFNLKRPLIVLGGALRVPVLLWRCFCHHINPNLCKINYKILCKCIESYIIIVNTVKEDRALCS